MTETPEEEIIRIEKELLVEEKKENEKPKPERKKDFYTEEEALSCLHSLIVLSYQMMRVLDLH